jgi:hypothetical protein
MRYPQPTFLTGREKKIFLKAPHRISLYKEKMPHLPLPPSPVITRWGTWIEACDFYCAHLEPLKNIILSLADEFRAIIECKELLSRTFLIYHLKFIQNHFSGLPKIISYFENQNISLKERMYIKTRRDTK